MLQVCRFWLPMTKKKIDIGNWKILRTTADYQNGFFTIYKHDVVCPDGSIGNLNCDEFGLINETDLSILLSKWYPIGVCPVPTPGFGFASADISGDCLIDETDLSVQLSHWKTQ